MKDIILGCNISFVSLLSICALCVFPAILTWIPMLGADHSPVNSTQDTETHLLYEIGQPCFCLYSHIYCYTPPISDIGQTMVYLVFGCIDYLGLSLPTYLITTVFVEQPPAKLVGVLITKDNNKKHTFVPVPFPHCNI